MGRGRAQRLTPKKKPRQLLVVLLLSFVFVLGSLVVLLVSLVAILYFLLLLFVLLMLS